MSGVSWTLKGLIKFTLSILLLGFLAIGLNSLAQKAKEAPPQQPLFSFVMPTLAPTPTLTPGGEVLAKVDGWWILIVPCGFGLLVIFGGLFARYLERRSK